MREAAGRNFLISFICYVAMALTLAALISHLNISDVLHGAGLGILVWFGFLATVGLTAHLVSQKPIAIYLIDTGYQLTYAITMAIIIASWP